MKLYWDGCRSFLWICVDTAEVLTPIPRAVTDECLAEGLEDIKEGRTYGPFTSVDTVVLSLHEGKPARQPG